MVVYQSLEVMWPQSSAAGAFKQVTGLAASLMKIYGLESPISLGALYPHKSRHPQLFVDADTTRALLVSSFKVIRVNIYPYGLDCDMALPY